MYYLYILKSQNFKRTYTGITMNVAKRLLEHNSGQVRSTHFYKPYILIYQEKFLTKTEARKRELELKINSFRKEVLFKKLSLQ